MAASQIWYVIVLVPLGVLFVVMQMAGHVWLVRRALSDAQSARQHQRQERLDPSFVAPAPAVGAKHAALLVAGILIGVAAAWVTGTGWLSVVGAFAGLAAMIGWSRGEHRLRVERVGATARGPVATSATGAKQRATLIGLSAGVIILASAMAPLLQNGTFAAGGSPDGTVGGCAQQPEVSALPGRNATIQVPMQPLAWASSEAVAGPTWELAPGTMNMTWKATWDRAYTAPEMHFEGRDAAGDLRVTQTVQAGEEANPASIRGVEALTWSVAPRGAHLADTTVTLEAAFWHEEMVWRADGRPCQARVQA